MNSDSYWGEIPTVADTDSGIAALEREQITKPQGMEVDGPPLHQPSSRHHPPSNEILSRQCTQMDPVVIHSIRLLQHIKKVQAATADTHSDIKSDPDVANGGLGVMPVYDGPPLSDPSKKKVYTAEDYNRPFVRGEGKSPPVLEEVTCRKLLRRSTAAICAHLSFESSSESVLETLTDVCHEFICEMTRHLADAADRRATHGCLGFPDIMERVFCEMGLGSVSDLHTFYQQRVLNYHRRLKDQCESLMAKHASQIKQPTRKAGSPSEGDTFNVIRIKEETSGDMNFPLLDDNDEVNEAEQLLNIESLGTFEITVEHETASGMTTEVDTKWPSSGKTEARLKSSASVDETSENGPGSATTGIVPVTPQSVKAATPLENVTTPHSATSRDPSSQEEITEVAGPTLSADIFSPSAPKAKKKKKI